MRDAIVTCAEQIKEAVTSRLNAGAVCEDIVPVAAFKPESLSALHAETLRLHSEVLCLARLSGLRGPLSVA